jgi:hypothetical protein
MSYRPNEAFVPKHRRKQYVSAVYCRWKRSDENLEQSINIEFCVKIGTSASETLALLTLAYDEYAMKKLGVSEWCRWFKEGREDVQDDPRSGQPNMQRTDANVDIGALRTPIADCYRGFRNGGKKNSAKMVL